MKAKLLMKYLHAAIEKNIITDDTDIDIAEEILPGRYRFLGEVVSLMSVEHNKDSIYLVAGGYDLEITDEAEYKEEDEK